MQKGIYNEWYIRNYNAYKVDTATAIQLQPLLNNTTIEIFLGSWCGDSKREVPRMMKILETANFDTSNVKLIFVNNDDEQYKQSPQGEEKNKFIHHVPTFIVYNNNNKEVNRIVETPIESLEKDLLNIVSNKTYTSKYKALLQWQKFGKKNKPLTNETLQQLASQYKPICKHAGEFNALGYTLMAEKNYVQAINVFKLNVLMYPTVSNAFDSLGEAYYKMGNKAEAKKQYEKVLELEPNNANAKVMLEKLK
jgi:tetratricopeptide (TPR) repeat protein